MKRTPIGILTLRSLGSPWALALAASFCALAGAAPARALSVAVPRDTIHGIVFDSLLHQPISDATVQADAGAITTRTDREGRFTLMSPDSIRLVTVFHDFLDRTGLGSLVARVTAKSSHSMFVLSTPSLATLWARVCPGKEMDKSLTGIVFGTARAPDGKTRVSGAQVRVSWDFDTPNAKGPRARISDAKTDSTGSYYACGAPAAFKVYVAGYSSTLKSGAVSIPGDSLPLRRVDLVLGEFGKTAAIHGIVRDAHQAPLAGAAIFVDGMTTETRTNANGQFYMQGVPTGTRSIEVRALGYAEMLQPIDVLDKQNDEIHLDMLATSLASVSITGKAGSLLKQDFEQRRREGFGTFKDSSEIVKHTSIRSIFQGIPSLVITGKDESAFSLYTPGQSLSAPDPASGCLANIYIDGQISDTSVLISLAKEQIAAIEVYIRQEFAPAQYLLLSNNCGVVLVWTKLQFNDKKK